MQRTQDLQKQHEKKVLSRKKIYERGLSLQGKPMTIKDNAFKTQILEYFKKSKADEKILAKDEITQYYFITAHCPPCSKPTANLAPMFITDLRIETHHLNRVLVIRLYGDPIVSAHNGMLWPVEDLQKNLAIVTLHNWHADPEEMCQLFNEDLVVAIKQPYFELCNRGGLYNVGIDHISDVHVLPVSHPMIARFYTEEERDKRCKKASKSGEGPAMTVSARRLILQQRDATVTLWTPTHLHRKMPKSRISGYSRGARKPTPGSATSTTPSSALKITTYRKNGTQNGRIEYLKANALHNLGKHRDCWMILECLDHLDELAELLHKAASMWLELWQAQTRPLDPNSTRTSYVDFTTIEEHEDGKPGLFAKRDFRANEIVLIERPLFVSKPERADRKFCIVDLEDR